MTGRSFVDTNIWVYAVDEADPIKQGRAKAALAAAAASGIVVSAQVIGEFFVTVTRKLASPLPFAVALDHVRDLLKQTVVPLDGRMVEAAMVGAQTWQMSYWDALLIVAARTAGADRLVTEDLQDGRIIDGVAIEDPFREPVSEIEAG